MCPELGAALEAYGKDSRRLVGHAIRCFLVLEKSSHKMLHRYWAGDYDFDEKHILDSM